MRRSKVAAAVECNSWKNGVDWMSTTKCDWEMHTLRCHERRRRRKGYGLIMRKIVSDILDRMNINSLDVFVPL